MKLWFYIGSGLVALWLQLTFASTLSIGGMKPNLSLMLLLLVGFRWMDHWLFIFGALLGLTVDVFSHGMLGFYGITFFFAAVVARFAGQAMYENNVWISMGIVAGLSLIHGIFVVTLFEIIDPEIPWWSWMFFKELPLALYHGVLTPLIFFPLVWLEKKYDLTESRRTLA